MEPQEFTRRLHLQLFRDRNSGFEPLRVHGRTSREGDPVISQIHVVIKATMAEKRLLQAEADSYRHLRNLQGQQIPVCLVLFAPMVTYWYHGELMAQMMILSRSGTRYRRVNNDEIPVSSRRGRQRVAQYVVG